MVLVYRKLVGALLVWAVVSLSVLLSHPELLFR